MSSSRKQRDFLQLLASKVFKNTKYTYFNTNLIKSIVSNRNLESFTRNEKIYFSQNQFWMSCHQFRRNLVND